MDRSTKSVERQKPLHTASPPTHCRRTEEPPLRTLAAGLAAPHRVEELVDRRVVVVLVGEAAEHAVNRVLYGQRSLQLPGDAGPRIEALLAGQRLGEGLLAVDLGVFEHQRPGAGDVAAEA